MAKLVVLPAALQDLIEIGDFIALDDPQRARSFIADIEKTLIKIADRPSSFPARDDLHPGIRAGRHGRYLIFFQMVATEVHVVRVLHGARDIPRILAS
ncbi:MAG: plasmid stabilization system protein [Rhizorhabdus sp.]|nr:plasmid stabilization system protein [Rhizorhabdus sp.]